MKKEDTVDTIPNFSGAAETDERPETTVLKSAMKTVLAHPGKFFQRRRTQLLA